MGISKIWGAHIKVWIFELELWFSNSLFGFTTTYPKYCWSCKAVHDSSAEINVP